MKFEYKQTTAEHSMGYDCGRRDYQLDRVLIKDVSMNINTCTQVVSIIIEKNKINYFHKLARKVC